MQYLDREPRRDRTTSSAVFFSDTTRTFIPLTAADVTTSAMTWDFPVPGGPWMTSPSESSSAAIILSWAESRGLAHMTSLSRILPSGMSGTRRGAPAMRSSMPLTRLPESMELKSLWTQLEYSGYLPRTANGIVLSSPSE